jgi:hypothetical protein
MTGTVAGAVTGAAAVVVTGAAVVAVIGAFVGAAAVSVTSLANVILKVNVKTYDAPFSSYACATLDGA